MNERSAENGFTSPERSAENTFESPKRSTENGFTLIEVIIALAIFAMISAAGVALLSFGIRAQAAATSRLDEVAQVRRMSVLLANDLAQALPRNARDLDGKIVRAFTGNDGSSDPLILGYVRGGWTNPDGAARAGVQRVDVTLEGGKLLRRGYAALDGTAAGQGIVLAEGITALALRYRDDKGEWRQRWDNAKLDALPAAVEMTITRGTAPPLTLAWTAGISYSPSTTP